MLTTLTLTFRLCNITFLHTRTVVQECCKDDDQCQWEKPKFDLRHPKPLNRSSPKFTYVITSRISTILENYIQIG